MAKVCLNMIVKNEAATIERCLQAALPFIDCCVISDTGSGDDTIAKIQAFCAQNHISCQIPEFSFVNFEQARNQSLQYCQQSDLSFDYILLLDADFELRIDQSAKQLKRQLLGHGYRLSVRHGQMHYQTLRLIPRNCTASYVGVTHEYLEINLEQRHLADPWIFDHGDGGSKHDKYQRDIRLLTEAIAQAPTNPRSWFYLGQSYFDLEQYQQAINAYERRIALGGWPEEVFYAHLRLARAKQQAGFAAIEVAHAYLVAYQYRPSRAEPLVDLAYFHSGRNEHALALLYARQARQLAQPNDVLFVETDSYSWKALDVIGISAYYLGAFDEGRQALEQLLAIAATPAAVRPRLEQNLAYYQTAS
jgi:glycosyltransferase involved in cell wall biosynthesis